MYVNCGKKCPAPGDKVDDDIKCTLLHTTDIEAWAMLSSDNVALMSCNKQRQNNDNNHNNNNNTHTLSISLNAAFIVSNDNDG